MKTIDIIIINSDENMIFNANNNYVILSVKKNFIMNLINEKITIQYNISNEKLRKKYYFNTTYSDPNSLVTSNFILSLNTNLVYIYDYFNSSPNKSIIICPPFVQIPIIYMGLINSTKSQGFLINLSYWIASDTLEKTTKKKIFLNSGSSNGYFNISNNKLIFSGDTWKIKISSIEPLLDSDTDTYELYNMDSLIETNINLKIYFYNLTKTQAQIKSIGYIEYLNTYPRLLVESIIILVQYKTVESTEIKQKILSFNFDLFDYKFAQSLNTNKQIYFNTIFLNDLNDSNDSNNSNNSNNFDWQIDSLILFDYDYEKYFNSLTYSNITNISYDLYSHIISNDINLHDPIIPSDLSPFPFNWNWTIISKNINLNLVSLGDLVNFQFVPDSIYKMTGTVDINFNTLVEYLFNYQLKLDNMYKIINQSNQSNESELNSTNKSIEYVNFSNNIINSIRSKIIFSFDKFNYIYSFDSKLFLDNYSIQVYHKKYLIGSDSDSDKKNLIKLILFINSMCSNIQIIFYNKYEDLIKLNSMIPTPYYIFNQLNLTSSLNSNKKMFDTNIGSNLKIANDEQENIYQKYLKLNIKINENYYILFFYSMLDYNEFFFISDQYSFKILRLEETNGNIETQYNLYWIVFQNLKELNIFMEFIKSGYIHTEIKKLSNYFNILNSKVFTNYYNLNNYWIYSTETNSEPKLNIYFSIDNLKINQIYVYGKIYINSM